MGNYFKKGKSKIPSTVKSSIVKEVAVQPVSIVNKPKKRRMRNAIPLSIRNDPFPKSKTVKLKYSQKFILTSGTAGVIGTEQVFRLNSMYDIDFTGTGHQSYFWDQLNTIYSKYNVDEVWIYLEFSDPGNDGTAIYAMLQHSAGVSTLTGSDESYVKEQPLTWQKVINTTGSQKVFFKQHIYLHKLEGIKKEDYKDAGGSYSAAVGANPTLCPYLRVAVGSDTSTTGAAVTVRATFIQKVKLWDRKTQTQS